MAEKGLKSNVVGLFGGTMLVASTAAHRPRQPM